jgi:hypothetical protein
MIKTLDVRVTFDSVALDVNSKFLTLLFQYIEKCKLSFKLILGNVSVNSNQNRIY